MEVLRVFTLNSGKVEIGAKIEDIHLENANVVFPAIIVGESGRNRKQGIVPVGNPPLETKLVCAEIGQTKAGKPKFWTKEEPTTDDKVIVVMRTKMGFRGGNDHTGDRIGWQCSCKAYGKEFLPPEFCPSCRGTAIGGMFSHFPGKIIAEGQIAEGDAGRMGEGTQLIAVVEKGVVFRTHYYGRLYGEPDAHYYMWDGRQILALTWAERCATDLF